MFTNYTLQKTKKNGGKPWLFSPSSTVSNNFKDINTIFNWANLGHCILIFFYHWEKWDLTFPARYFNLGLNKATLMLGWRCFSLILLLIWAGIFIEKKSCFVSWLFLLPLLISVNNMFIATSGKNKGNWPIFHRPHLVLSGAILPFSTCHSSTSLFFSPSPFLLFILTFSKGSFPILIFFVCFRILTSELWESFAH